MDKKNGKEGYFNIIYIFKIYFFYYTHFLYILEGRWVREKLIKVRLGKSRIKVGGMMRENSHENYAIYTSNVVQNSVPTPTLLTFIKIITKKRPASLDYYENNLLPCEK